MDFHDRLVERAVAMGASNVRVVHRGTRRPHLTGVVDGTHFILGLPLRPRDLPQNFFASLRDLRRVISTIRKRTNPAAA
jgi:hypothetical protein